MPRSFVLLPLLATVLWLSNLSTSMADDSEKKPAAYHLLILSGQSNMAGMKPATGLEPELKRLFNIPVVYIKVASGGKPIRFWLDDWAEIAKRNGLDGEAVEKKDKQSPDFYAQILKQYRETLKKRGKPASVTFCWMQGERDAREKLSAAYGESLKRLIARLRKDVGEPEMPFVIGRLSDFGKPDNEHWQQIRKIQVQVAADDDHGAWVDCDDLNNKKNKQGVVRDDLHYTAEGYATLGRRYARQMRLLLSGKSPAEDGRPE